MSQQIEVNGRKHDERCAHAKSDVCQCACGGRYHGLSTGRIARDQKTKKPLFILQGEKSYQGKSHGDLNWEVNVTNGIETIPLNKRLDLVNHSPDGFAWGYGGSGPSQLALALLADALEDDKLALSYYQTFKWEKIATINQDIDWSMSAKEIKEWVQEQILKRSIPMEESH